MKTRAPDTSNAKIPKTNPAFFRSMLFLGRKLMPTTPFADKEPASEVPRAQSTHGEWPSGEIEGATGAPLPGTALVSQEETPAFEVLSFTKFSLEPDPAEFMAPPCTRESGGGCTPREVTTINPVSRLTTNRS